MENKTMQVLMLGWEFPPHISGGLGTACYGLTLGLQDIGEIDLTFVLPRLWGDEVAGRMRLIGAGCDAEPVVAPYASAAQYASEGARHEGALFDAVLDYRNRVAALLASMDQYDMIHAHDWLTYPAAIAAKNLCGAPLVAHVHSTEFDRAGAHIDQRIVDIERQGMLHADKIIAVSKGTRDTIVRRYGVSPEKVAVVYNAVEMPPVAPALLLAPIAAGDQAPTVTFVGRVTYQKGPEYFIEAASLIRQKNRQVRFVLAGDGDMLPFVKQLAAGLGILDAVEFPGFLNAAEVRALYARSAVYVMPSVSEPFGIAALEAIAHGVPAIVAPCAGMAEVFDCVIKVDSWDVETIAAHVLALLDNHALADALRRGAARELKNLSWTSSARQISRLYRDLLQHAGGGDVTAPALTSDASAPVHGARALAPVAVA